MRMVRHWDRFHREVMDVSSLKVFEVSLDGLMKSLPRAGGLELGDHKGPFQPKTFYGSVIYSFSINGSIDLQLM